MNAEAVQHSVRLTVLKPRRFEVWRRAAQVDAGGGDVAPAAASHALDRP
jgi:hypothetical protein